MEEMLCPIQIVDNGFGCLVSTNNFIDIAKIPSNKGIILGGEHRGFVVYEDDLDDGCIEVYTGPIIAVAYQDSKVKIFEEGYRFPWVVEHGVIKECSKFDSESLAPVNRNYVVMDNPDLFGPKAKIDGKICVEVQDPQKDDGVIRFTEKGIGYMLHPGFVLLRDCYGFMIENKGRFGKTMRCYRTQYPLESIKGTDDGFVVFERGKYLPWKFSDQGELVHEAKYMPFSNKDITAVKKVVEEKTITLGPKKTYR